MTVMSEIEWDSCLLEPKSDPEFKRRYKRETGRPDFTARYFTGTPWIENALIALYNPLKRSVVLDAKLGHLVGMVVSQDNSCRYCFAVSRAFSRILGMPEARILQLEQDLMTADFDEAERTALEFARRVSRSNPLPTEDDVTALRKLGFDQLQIAELAGLVALNVFFNRLSTLCALPPEQMESMPDRWFVRLMRPLFAFGMRKDRKPGKPDPLRPEEREGSFSPIVVALDGLPTARALRAAIDGMWESTVLSRRTKALVFAVVARALGCPVSEREAGELVLAEGLDGEQLDEILAHLASPVLDDVERIAVPFARETVWYQPVQIQHRSREVMAALSRDQFVELVAVASLANAVCRLGIVTGSCE